MDATAFSVLFFALLKLALWLGVFGFAFWIGRAIYTELNPKPVEPAEGEVAEELAEPDLADILWHWRYWLGGWILLFFAAIFFSQAEMAYRPKTVVQPDNPVLEQQLRELDRRATPEIGPAEGDLRDQANTGYSEQNAAENEAARKKFLELPEAD